MSPTIGTGSAAAVAAFVPTTGIQILTDNHDHARGHRTEILTTNKKNKNSVNNPRINMTINAGLSNTTEFTYINRLIN